MTTKGAFLDRRLWLALGVALLLLLATGVYTLSRGSSEQNAPERRTERGEGDGEDMQGPDLPETSVDPLVDGTRPPATDDEPDGVVGGAGATPPRPEIPPAAPVVDIDSLPPAMRPNPRTPPPLRPGSRPLGPGGRPPTGPTGLWEKFPPSIPRGRAALEVRVLDKDGEPIQGATVYIGPPEHAGASAVSFGDLRQVGKTNALGMVTAGGLPEGAASVAGNLDNLLNGRRGLDMRSAVKVALTPNRMAAAEIRLPLLLSEFGALSGVVLTTDSTPLRRASVTAGFQRVYTDGAGHFAFSHLPQGTTRVSASRSGYAGVATSVLVEAGKSAETEIRLGYRETGSLLLTGRVVGPDEAPVPDATVYLIAKSGMGGGTIRTEKTDGTGAFRMDSLPDRLAETEVRVQANRVGYRAGNTVLPDGLKGPEVVVRMPAKLVRLRLMVRDSKSREPQLRCRFEATQEGLPRPAASFSSRSENGVYDRTWIPPGTYQFLVETPDHEPHRATVEIRPGLDETEYVADVIPTGSTAKEVVLTVAVSSATTGEPVEQTNILLLPVRGGAAVAGMAATRPGGEFVIPVPEGRWILRVSAPGYQMLEEHVEVGSNGTADRVDVGLYPE